jgi:transglutaminase-like putative cysteine protease
MIVVALLGRAAILFPSPLVNPGAKPQLPRSVALSATRDRVLFEVAGPAGDDPPVSGPWIVGVLDVYDGANWRLPPSDARRLVSRTPTSRARRSDERTVTFTIRDFGDVSVLPSLPTTDRAQFSGRAALFDPRTGTFQSPNGPLPAGYSYSESVPAWPTVAQLEAADPSLPDAMTQFLTVPAPPPAVADQLKGASPNPWLRLDHLLKIFNSVVIAAGAGVPVAVPPAKVQDLLAGDHIGNPFEIVAAEALLARWAGVPSRIGYGFDGFQREGERRTVRPRNATTFLEVYFNGYGWVPLVLPPRQARSSS